MRRATLTLGLIWATATPGAAQDASAFRHSTLQTHAHGTVVAVAIRLPVGSKDDAPGREGTAWLLAHTLEAQAARALGPGADVRAEVTRAGTLFQLVALPDGWEDAARSLEDILFGDPIDLSIMELQRQDLLRSISFEEGSPVHDFEEQSAELLSDAERPWGRELRGTAESLGQIGAQVVTDFRADLYRRAAAARAVVGPVAVAPEPDTMGLDSLGAIGPGPPSGADTAASSAGVEPGLDTALLAVRARGAVPPVAELAWIRGYRREIVVDVTNSWITVAYPVPSDLPRTHLELVAHLLREELDPVPPDPDRFSVEVRLTEAENGPVLVVEASVFPEAADRWESRILGATERLATVSVPEDFFHWRRRRFRAARLLAEVAPEVEAARLAADLLRGGEVRDLALEIWALDSQAVLDAAASLGDPRILRMGPDLAQEGGSEGRSGGSAERR